MNRLQVATLIALFASIGLITLGSLAARSDYGPFLILFNMAFQTLFWPVLAAQAALQRLESRESAMLAGSVTLGIALLGLYFAHTMTGSGQFGYDWVLALNGQGRAETVQAIFPLVAAKVCLTAIIPFILASLPEADRPGQSATG